MSVSAMLLEPEGCWQGAPPAAAHVHVPLVPTGSRSLTSVPGASDGPAFETTIVYVVEVPGTAVAVPSSLLTDTFVCAWTVVWVVLEPLLEVSPSVVPLEET